MTDVAPVLGVLAVLVGIADTIPYVRDVLRGTTRPHRGTWLIWSVLAIVVASLAGLLAAGAVGMPDLSLLLYPVYFGLVNGAIAILIHHRRAVAPPAGHTGSRRDEGLGGAQDGRQQAWEACLEVVVAERVDARLALVALVDDAGLAQDLEVMRAGRFGDGDVEAAAGAPLERGGESADHQQPDGIAERVQDGRELDLVAVGMGERLDG